MYPLALEGALKIKEISYVHAEGLPAGEMKHGHIALIEEGMPVVGLVPSSILADKSISNLQEVTARGARVIAIVDEHTEKACSTLASRLIIMPTVSTYAAPIVYSAALQLLAYHTALLKGTNVDKPRNLAKSVTVE